MRAIVITRPGGPDVLMMTDAADPVPGPRQIRVRVHAAGVNRADLLQRAGMYPAPTGAPQNVPGLEYAGVVDAVDGDVTRWKAGDRVMGLVGGGAYAEYIVTHEDEAIRVPGSLSLVQAAAIPESFITAHDALFTRMALRQGESLLIHAVGSGVGTAALQLAQAAGAFVVGTQRSAWKLDRATSLGLDVAILIDGDSDSASTNGIRGHRDFDAEVVARVEQWRARRRASGDDNVVPGAGNTAAGANTDGGANTEPVANTAAGVNRPHGRGVDAILDLVGGDYLTGNLRAIRVLGRIIVVGLVAGARAELDMRLLLRKRATIMGTVLRARMLEEKVAAARAFEADVVPLLESGTIAPVIDRVLPLEHADRAHALMEANGTFGRIVLEIA